MYLVLKIKIGFKKLSNHMQVHRIITVVILDLTPAKIYYLSEEEQVLI